MGYICKICNFETSKSLQKDVIYYDITKQKNIKKNSSFAGSFSNSFLWVLAVRQIKESDVFR